MDEQNQQQALPPQQPPIPPQNVNPMPSPHQPLYGKRNWLKWVFVYPIIAVLIYGGIYYLATQQKKSSPYSTNSPSPTIAKPTPTPDPTANWNIYTSKEIGYVIKYPAELYVTELEDTTVFTTAPYPTDSLGPLERIEVSLRDNYKAQDFDALFKAEQGSDVPEAHHAVDVKINKIRNFKVDNYDAVEFIRDGTVLESGLGRGPIGYEHNVLIKKNNQEFIQLSNTSMEVKKTKERDMIFNKMVATFKFITADWKEYSNKTQGYFIKYPPNWMIEELEGGVVRLYYSSYVPKGDEYGPNFPPEMRIKIIDQPFSESPKGNVFVQLEGGVELEKFVDWEKIIADGKEGHYYRGMNCAPVCPTYFDLPYASGNQTLQVTALITPENKTYLDHNLFKKIVSAFKFTSQ